MTASVSVRLMRWLLPTAMTESRAALRVTIGLALYGIWLVVGVALAVNEQGRLVSALSIPALVFPSALITMTGVARRNYRTAIGLWAKEVEQVSAMLRGAAVSTGEARSFSGLLLVPTKLAMRAQRLELEPRIASSLYALERRLRTASGLERRSRAEMKRRLPPFPPGADVKEGLWVIQCAFKRMAHDPKRLLALAARALRT